VVSLPNPVECLHEDGHLETVNISGRHDRQAVRRAPVIVESMTALCLINYLL
jgi:chorismate synthase